MTKSAITRERLEWLSQISCRDDIEDIGGDEIRELASMALAAMDSEPDCKERQLFCSTDTSRMRKVTSVSAGSEATPLHRHAQPAPVVPDAMEPTIEAIKRILPTSNPDEYAACIGADMWNACRATMLAAAQHDTPALNSVQSVVTVPGKWIPVSERMPEVGDIVLTAMGGSVNISEMECSAANCRFFTSVISGRELPATHWMPLPASPQEPKP